jgi:hypothetical protein
LCLNAVVLIGRGRVVVVGIVLSFSFLNTLILSLLKSFFSNGFVIIFVFETKLVEEDSSIIFLPEGFTVSLFSRGRGTEGCLLMLL